MHIVINIIWYLFIFFILLIKISGFRISIWYTGLIICSKPQPEHGIDGKLLSTRVNTLNISLPAFMDHLVSKLLLEALEHSIFRIIDWPAAVRFMRPNGAEWPAAQHSVLGCNKLLYSSRNKLPCYSCTDVQLKVWACSLLALSS